MGVRFISVNDHFDTNENHNGNKELEIALKNLVNDMYAEIYRSVSALPENRNRSGAKDPKEMGTYLGFFEKTKMKIDQKCLC